MEAAGGVPPYSYQWKVYYIGKGNWGGFFNWWYNCYSPLTNANDSTYYATMGNYAYYCVVTDDAGGKATSAKAEVLPALYIEAQPRNTNLYGRESINENKEENSA